MNDIAIAKCHLCRLGRLFARRAAKDSSYPQLWLCGSCFLHINDSLRFFGCAMSSLPEIGLRKCFSPDQSHWVVCVAVLSRYVPTAAGCLIMLMVISSLAEASKDYLRFEGIFSSHWSGTHDCPSLATHILCVIRRFQYDIEVLPLRRSHWLKIAPLSFQRCTVYLYSAHWPFWQSRISVFQRQSWQFVINRRQRTILQSRAFRCSTRFHGF